MDRILRLALLVVSLVYFSFCIAGGLEVSRVVHHGMISVFIVFGCVVVARYLVLLAAAILEKNRARYNIGGLTSPFVSIIVPAFNEERLIELSLTSLAMIDYKNYEIIVVDDGSSDGTARISHQVAARYPQVMIKVISQSNSGKSWALNTGIAHAEGELILCVDADSVLDRDVLKTAVPHFEDPKVGAVGGAVDVINDVSVITRLQQLEYVIGINFLRRGLSFFNIVAVIPGPIGVFRAEAIREVGGYNTSGNCFAEDADLTIRLLVNGWRVKGETRMVAHTEAPDSVYHLLRQRYRWKRGLFQAWFGNIGQLLRQKSLSGVFVAMILMFESFMFDVINFGITVFGLTSFLAFGEFRVFIIWTVLLAALDLVVFVFCNIDQSRLIGRLWLFVLSKISYAYLLQAWGVLALFDEWLTTKMNWDKLERVGGVPLKHGS